MTAKPISWRSILMFFPIIFYFQYEFLQLAFPQTLFVFLIFPF